MKKTLGILTILVVSLVYAGTFAFATPSTLCLNCPLGLKKTRTDEVKSAELKESRTEPLKEVLDGCSVITEATIYLEINGPVISFTYARRNGEKVNESHYADKIKISVSNQILVACVRKENYTYHIYLPTEDQRSTWTERIEEAVEKYIKQRTITPKFKN